MSILPATGKSEQRCQSIANFEEVHFILHFNQTIFWLRIADIIRSLFQKVNAKWTLSQP